MYNISIESLYDAYYDTNRNTADMVPFSLRIDEEIYKLWQEIRAGEYRISKTKAFMVNDSKKREIFAMQPRDKIVDHWVKLHIEPLLEMEFSNACYSCRKGLGLSAFARDAEAAIRRVTNNFTKPCYFARLDIRSFFFSINRKRALEKILEIIEGYEGDDKDTLKWLIREVILFAPENNYYIVGNPADWDDYPAEKSLLTNDPGCGLMLGRVSSQYVANFYLNDTDKFIMSLGIEVLRYVDDFLLISDDKRRILEHIFDIEQFLYRDTGLTLHFHKRYFQSLDKGVSVVGYAFKGDRTYISKRCVGRAITRVRSFGRRVREVDMFVSSVNSYLGRTMDCRAYNQRLKIINSINPVWWKEVYVREHLRKIVKRGKISNFEKIKI